MTDVAPRQIYRNTDEMPGGKPNLKTIQIISREEDGRWLAETVTGYDGTKVARSRKTRLKSSTLASDYVLVTSNA